MDAKHKRLHALGGALYGQGEAWDIKRHELVKAISQGRTESSDELTAAELDYMIDGMSEKLEAKRAAEAHAAAMLAEIAADNAESAVHETPATPRQAQDATTPPTPAHTEATALVWFDVVIGGVQLNVTMRAGTSADETLNLLREATKVATTLQKHGAIPVLRREATEAMGRAGLLPSFTQPVASQPAKPAATPPAAPAAPIAPPAPAPANGAQSEHGGAGALRTITVKPDGGVEFEVEGLKYPLKDKRGPKTVAALFAPALGWTEAHFANPAIYTPQGLVVDWVKKERYYDVVRVHA